MQVNSNRRFSSHVNTEENRRLEFTCIGEIGPKTVKIVNRKS